MKLFEQTKRLAAKLWQEHASPTRLGVAVAVGVLVGCSPFYGGHFLICLGCAYVLRLNKVAVILGAQISIPPIAPFIGFSSVQLGSLILDGKFAHVELTGLGPAGVLKLLGDFFTDWLLGGLLVGAVLGSLLFLPTVALVTWRRRRAMRLLAARPKGGALDGGSGQGVCPPVHTVDGQPFPGRSSTVSDDELAAAAQRYHGARREHRYYAHCKYRQDPVYRKVCDAIGHVDRVVDLGTGLGMLPALLLVRGQARQVIGVEWDASKVKTAAHALSGLDGFQLVQADLRICELPPADAVVLADVLHYYPEAEQRAVVTRAAAALRPGGLLVIRETDRHGQSTLTRWIETVAVKLKWNRGPGLHFCTADELLILLSELGLDGSVATASSRVHRGNILVLGRKPCGH